MNELKLTIKNKIYMYALTKVERRLLLVHGDLSLAPCKELGDMISLRSSHDLEKHVP